MPAIVLEGRDESGKTTLAEQLSDFYLAPIVKSPAGKGSEWEDHWNSWVIRHAQSADLSILDRTPEISELVYGTGRGEVRSPPLSQCLWAWKPLPIFFILCQPVWHDPIMDHYDAIGSTLTADHLRMVDFGYAMLYQIMRKESTARFEVIRYNYREAKDALTDRIYQWRKFV